VKVLVVNDDGPNAVLEQLLTRLKEAGHDVVAVVPERARSATGLARTYHKPLRLRCLRRDICVVNGYPSDAVVLGLKLIMPDADIVLSGINDGANLGFVSTYGSGTVSEEVGLVGARSLASNLKPRAVIAVDVLSCCSPSINGEVKPGAGPVIRLVDNYGVHSVKLAKTIEEIARRESIPVQVGGGGGGTDAAAFLQSGIPAITIGIPAKYTHSTVEMVHIDDIDNTLALVEALANNVDKLLAEL